MEAEIGSNRQEVLGGIFMIIIFIYAQDFLSITCIIIPVALPRR